MTDDAPSSATPRQRRLVIVATCAVVVVALVAAVIGFRRSHLLYPGNVSAPLIVEESAGAATPAHPGVGPLEGLANLGAQVVFHTYDEYADGSSAIWLYDTVTSETTLVSAGWRSRYGITDPMNPMVWPGSTAQERWLTFMAVADDEWNVFMVDVDSDDAPVNLTRNSAGSWGRNEDPKFSADGEQLFFKRDGDVVVADLAWDDGVPRFDGGLRWLTDTRWAEQHGEDLPYVGDDQATDARNSGEESMPFPAPDGDTVYFTRGTGADADLWLLKVGSGEERLVSGIPGVSEYYPIVSTNGTVFFARWTSAEDEHDTIMAIYPGEERPHRLLARAGADVADPAPVTGPDLLVFSMTGAHGAFELHVMDVPTGELAQLPLDGVPGNMLGAHVWLPPSSS